MSTKQQLAELLTPAALAAWLTEQDPERKYIYIDNDHCLLAQYLRASGFPANMGAFHFNLIDDDIERVIPEALNDIASGFPRTFGAALDRAKGYI